jgi:DNA (cytosine-5)-methyltransferase 3A
LEKSKHNYAAEPIRIPEYGMEDKARPLNANYSNNCGGFEHRMFNENPKKQQVDMVAAPVRIGTYPNDSKNQGHDSQQYRIYSTDGKSVNLCGNGGGMGAKTGLYAIPVKEDNVLSNEYWHGGFDSPLIGMVETPMTARNGKQPSQHCRVYSCDDKFVCLGTDSRNRIIATYEGFAIPIEFDGSKPIKAISFADGKEYPVYEVKDGQITIKGKQYPIKLADGFYIIRKLTVTECKRLQTVPEWFEFPVSDTRAYQQLGNGWTVSVIEHLIRATQADELDDEQLDLFKMIGV